MSLSLWPLSVHWDWGCCHSVCPCAQTILIRTHPCLNAGRISQANLEMAKNSAPRARSGACTPEPRKASARIEAKRRELEEGQAAEALISICEDMEGAATLIAMASTRAECQDAAAMLDTSTQEAGAVAGVAALICAGSTPAPRQAACADAQQQRASSTSTQDARISAACCDGVELVQEQARSAAPVSRKRAAGSSDTAPPERPHKRRAVSRAMSADVSTAQPITNLPNIENVRDPHVTASTEASEAASDTSKLSEVELKVFNLLHASKTPMSTTCIGSHLGVDIRKAIHGCVDGQTLPTPHVGREKGWPWPIADLCLHGSSPLASRSLALEDRTSMTVWARLIR